MPTPFLKKLSKETGKSIKTLESYWDEAKHTTSEKFHIPESKFKSKHWGYTTSIVKRRAKKGDMSLPQGMRTGSLGRDIAMKISIQDFIPNQ